MKRSPLNRRTPLQRKTWMKRMSAKKAKEKRETDGPRAAFRDRVGECMFCGSDNRLQVHEIANGPNRHKAVYEECLQLVLCQRCHELFHDKRLFHPARQLAIRCRWDVMESVRKLRDVRGDSLVGYLDVLQWMT